MNLIVEEWDPSSVEKKTDLITLVIEDGVEPTQAIMAEFVKRHGTGIDIGSDDWQYQIDSEIKNVAWCWYRTHVKNHVRIVVEHQDENGKVICRDYTHIPQAEYDQHERSLNGWGVSNFHSWMIEKVIDAGVDGFDLVMEMRKAVG